MSRLAWLDSALLCCVLAGSGCTDDGETVADATGEDDGPSTSDDPATSNADTTTEPPPPVDPMVEPGSCGYGSDGYACGWANPNAARCPAGAMPGGSCETPARGDFVAACCLDETTLLRCSCLDNACDYQWYSSDCSTGQGAGACGWRAADGVYGCGGEGTDPATPMECPPPDPMSVDGCEGAPLGTTCCDADGNARLCTDFGSNGVANWVITDCVLDD